MTEVKTSIRLTEPLKVYLESDPIIFVNKSKKERSDETRLYFEICLAVSMLLLGEIIHMYLTDIIPVFIIVFSVAIFLGYRFRKIEKSGTFEQIEGVIKDGNDY